MGLFDVFRKNPMSTAESMVDEYNKNIRMGILPKKALCNVFDLIKNKHEGLSSEDPNNFLSSVFGEDFEKLSKSPKIAKSFSVRVIMNLISAYLHREVFTDEHLNNKLSRFIENSIL